MLIFYANVKFRRFPGLGWVIFSTYWEFFCRTQGIKKIFKICLIFTEIEKPSGLNAPFEA